MRKPIVGLTGGIGSGKSTVAQLFAAHGVPCIDSDVVAHQLTAAGGAAMAEIRAAFGERVLDEHGALNRAAMRELVFAKPAERLRLESILHPMIREECLRQLERVSGPYVLLAVPLLFETPAFRTLVNRSLVVDCPEETQQQRVMARSGLAAVQVAAIIAAQMPRQQRLQLADDVIHNAGELADLALQVDEKHRYYLACFGLPAPA
ncbi:dephospho-CoA kinase [Vogesella oryzae]|uniref:dephospho-CoA kinase n=1 Tax=Vogesella oryzae TaxID=1735285 RepID=UPI001FE549DA|nr:dephospho-CoA kinase [Vogesella oryzae]